MKEILLTRRIITYLDDEVWDIFKDYNWQAIPSFQGKTTAKWKPGKLKHYARRTACVNGYTLVIYLHRQLMGVPKPFLVRHKNSDYLDNQHYNLLIEDEWGNKYCFRKFSPKSKYKGVIWDRANGLWRAEVHGLVIGYYIVEIDAARAYNLKMKEMFGTSQRKLNTISILRQYNKNKEERE